MGSSVYLRRKSHRSLCKFSFLAAIFLMPLYAVAATHEVTVGNNFFSPNDLEIEVGDTVRWTNNSGRLHDVTADDGSFASETSSSFVYERTFNSVGEILYYCSVHSDPGRNRNTFMNGRINVVAANDTTDVGIDSVDATGGAHEAGKTLTVEVALSNLSNADSGMFNVDFYISEDANVTSADTLVSSVQVTNIMAGGNSELQEDVLLPANLLDGDYFIGVIIDLADANVSNNSNMDDTAIFVFTEFIMNAGLSDAWYYPVTDGQGFFIAVFPNLGRVALAWFTYDTELPPEDALANLGDPGHRWLTASAKYTGNQAVLNIVLTSNGIFDMPTEVIRTEPKGSDGTLTLTFENCNSGTVEYDITSINAQGTVPIQRVAIDNAALCDALLREIIMAQ